VNDLPIIERGKLGPVTEELVAHLHAEIAKYDAKLRLRIEPVEARRRQAREERDRDRERDMAVRIAELMEERELALRPIVNQLVRIEMLRPMGQIVLPAGTEVTVDGKTIVALHPARPPETFDFSIGTANQPTD
jgi:hypothetical protein